MFSTENTLFINLLHAQKISNMVQSVWEVFCDGRFMCLCRCRSTVWNDRDLPAQQEAVEFASLSLCEPNRGRGITVSLPGGKHNTEPISNLVFHKIWQLLSDDKLTEILSPPGNLWRYNSTHTLLSFSSKKQSGACWACWEHETQLKAENDLGCIIVWLQIQVQAQSGKRRRDLFCDIQHLAELLF